MHASALRLALLPVPGGGRDPAPVQLGRNRRFFGGASPTRPVEGKGAGFQVTGNQAAPCRAPVVMQKPWASRIHVGTHPSRLLASIRHSRPCYSTPDTSRAPLMPRYVIAFAL